MEVWSWYNSSQSTGVNIGKKQRWCCQWSAGYIWLIFEFWVVYICKQNRESTEEYSRCKVEKRHWTEIYTVSFLLSEKRRGLTQSYDKSPYTDRKIQKATWQHKNPQKTSITQRLRTDLEQILYEFRFLWIQKYVGETRGPMCTHLNADCLLEDFSGKNQEYIVN